MNNRDEVEGRAENLKGRIKEAAGTLTGNPDLENEGASERAGGALKEGIARARRKIGEEIEEIGENLKR
ncbi:MAG TPA: CsbD family protein [Thermoanaerobaculia bacterium]